VKKRYDVKLRRESTEQAIRVNMMIMMMMMIASKFESITI